MHRTQCKRCDWFKTGLERNARFACLDHVMENPGHSTTMTRLFTIRLTNHFALVDGSIIGATEQDARQHIVAIQGGVDEDALTIIDQRS